MAEPGEQSQLRISGLTDEPTNRVVEEFNHRLESRSGASLVESLGTLVHELGVIASSGELLYINPIDERLPADQLTNNQLVLRLADLSNDGTFIILPKNEDLEANIEKDWIILNIIEELKHPVFKPGSPEHKLRRRIYNLQRVKLYGELVLGSQTHQSGNNLSNNTRSTNRTKIA
jgi:hypothetical protein